ncbi:MAG: isoprenylcysteine carboxylmethyltransferase family protein [Gammaproteobacteria bacterium]|nr:MAG: isoprenylcysteine carboxylmethyltransferase family protein [Gammaproteobacteria bacterium]
MNEQINPVSSPKLSFWQKITADPFPFVFFGLILGYKLFSLTGMVINTFFPELVPPEARAQAQATYVSLGLLAFAFFAVIFDVLIIASYLLRSEPVSRARGFWERQYPLITVLFPMVGNTLLFVPEIRANVPPIPLDQLGQQWGIPGLPAYVETAGLIFSLLGTTLSIISLWSLKRSFSVMTEVRHLVTTGLYRYVRHPLYMSEIIHAIGLVLLSAHPIIFGVTVITIILQVIRAKIEERKFLQTLPQYAEYRKRTGFLWPKFS